ncbi:MAG: XisI protein [Gammaproteobacteria bacterium]|nr:XisI protein [Gammaproteobacteria bacterium]
MRNEKEYQKRFSHFNAHFYKKIYGGKTYPPEYAEQGILHKCPEDRLLFLALNSCWEIDHYYTDHAGINADALARALDQLLDGYIDDKIWIQKDNTESGIADELEEAGIPRKNIVLGVHHVDEMERGIPAIVRSKYAKIRQSAGKRSSASLGKNVKFRLTKQQLKFNTDCPNFKHSARRKFALVPEFRSGNTDKLRLPLKSKRRNQPRRNSCRQEPSLSFYH